MVTKATAIFNFYKFHNFHTVYNSYSIKLCNVLKSYFFLSHYRRERSSKYLYIFLHLEALAMDDSWTRLIIFLLADPHLLEG